MVALPVTFEEAFEGKTANVTVARERLCRTCGGTGASDPGEMPTVRRAVASTLSPGSLLTEPRFITNHCRDYQHSSHNIRTLPIRTKLRQAREDSSRL